MRETQRWLILNSMYGSNEEEKMSVKGSRLYLLWLVYVYVYVCVLCVRERDSVYGNDKEEEMGVVGSKFHLLQLC